MEDLGHLDLSKETSTLVGAKTRSVPNRKGVRACMSESRYFRIARSPLVVTFRGSQPFKASIPLTSEKVT
jgi:hypothetical protein